jgi:hypothetical protein
LITVQAYNIPERIKSRFWSITNIFKFFGVQRAYFFRQR